MRAFSWIPLLTVFSSLPALAQAQGFPPQEFETVRARFLEIYSPIVKAGSGLGLRIKLDEEVPNYFGGVDITDGQVFVLMGSRFDREPKVTPDFYALILCHEVGHLLAGEPRKAKKGERWSSVEGQSDYYAAAVCLPKLFSDPILAAGAREFPVSPRVAGLCSEAYSSEAERGICRRIAHAGLDMFDYLVTMYYEDYRGRLPMPDFDSPEPAGLSASSEYPSFQCRLDTFVAGAVLAPRPACWFRP